MYLLFILVNTMFLIENIVFVYFFYDCQSKFKNIY
jgi:hypothetical protein